MSSGGSDSHCDMLVSGNDASAIQALVARYFGFADGPESAGVSDLFSESGQLLLGTMSLTGREAIAAFFIAREKANKEALRVTRHVSGPIDLRRLDENRVYGRATVIVYAGSGDLPFAAGVPSTICDFDDIYQRRDDQWFFAKRQASVLFLGPGAANFAKQRAVE